MDLGLLQGISEGFKQGLQSYQEQKSRNQNNKMLVAQMMAQGIQQDANGNFVQTPEKMREKSLEQATKQAGLLKAGYKADLNSDTNQYELNPIEGFKDLEHEKTQAEIELKQAQKKAFEAKAKKGAGGLLGGGKTVPANDAVQSGSVSSSLSALDDVDKMIQANKDLTGPFQGRLSQLAASAELGDTGKRAKVLRGTLRTNAQIIGKYLEGGKLTDADIDRYEQALPTLNDSPEVAANKVAELKRRIAQKQNSELTALQQAGYNTSRMDRAEAGEGSSLLKQKKVTASPFDRMSDEELTRLYNQKVKGGR